VLERSTGRFCSEIEGTSHAELTHVTLTIEAPGHDPVSRRFDVAAKGETRKIVLAVLDPVGVPSLGP
jgi:hypothetical protein